MKVDELSHLELERKETEIRESCEEQKREFEDIYENEKEKINEEFERKTREVMEKFRKLELELDEKYSKEIDSFVNDYNKVNKVANNPSDIKILQKNLELCVKNKKYSKL